MVRIEVFLQIPNHLLARVTIDPQERMVIGNTVDALADCLLVESFRTILPRESLNRVFLLLNVPLDFTARSALMIDFTRGRSNKIVTEKTECIILLEY